jgi:hypothetical protein
VWDQVSYLNSVCNRISSLETNDIKRFKTSDNKNNNFSLVLKYNLGIYPYLDVMWDVQSGVPGSRRGLFMWDLWWKKWHSDRFPSDFFVVLLSLSFHHCSPYPYITQGWTIRP